MAVSVANLQACDSFCIHLRREGWEREREREGRREGRQRGEEEEKEGGREREREIITKEQLYTHTHNSRQTSLDTTCTWCRGNRGESSGPHPKLLPLSPPCGGSECGPRHHSVWNGSMGTWELNSHQHLLRSVCLKVVCSHTLLNSLETTGGRETRRERDK